MVGNMNMLAYCIPRGVYCRLSTVVYDRITPVGSFFDDAFEA